MPEQLAIAPPPPERQSPQNEEDDEVLSGVVVVSNHEGLKDSIDATPDREDEPADIVTEAPQDETPEAITVVDAGVDENGKRQAYERTYTRKEEGDYQENVGARRKTTILSPDGEGGWTANNPYNSHQDSRRTETGRERSIYDDFLENKVPPFRGYQEHDEQRISEELRRREAAAQAAGEILQDLIGLNKQERLGIFDPTHEFYGEWHPQDIEVVIARIQEGLRSDDPEKRAEATNALLDAIDTLRELRYGEKLSAEDKLNRHVFSPGEMRNFLYDIQDGITWENDSTHEKLSDEERRIADLIVEYGISASFTAHSEDLLIDGAAVFGSAAETLFKKSLTENAEPQLEKLSKEDIDALVGSTFHKLRQRAVGHMTKVPRQTLNEPLKEVARARHAAHSQQSRFGLAA